MSSLGSEGSYNTSSELVSVGALGSPEYWHRPAAHRPPGSAPRPPIEAVSRYCQEAQARILSLQQAIARQPGISGSTRDLVTTDLRAVAQLFIAAQHAANGTTGRLQEEVIAARADTSRVLADLNRAESKAAAACREKEEMQAGFFSYSEKLQRENAELKAKVKSQIKAIEALANNEAVGPSHNLDAQGSRADLPNFVSGMRSQRRTQSAMYSNYNGQRQRLASGPSTEEMTKVLQDNLKRLEVDQRSAQMEPKDPDALQKYLRRASSAGMSLMTTGRVPRRGSNTWVQPSPSPMPGSFGRAPASDPMMQLRQPSPVAGPSNALVVRRDNDADNDPETKVWKEMFFKLFTMVYGWAEKYCGVVRKDVTQQLAKADGSLWDYVCSVTYPKDRRAGTNHATYLLNNRETRVNFITRLVLQYVEKNMLNHTLWLGFLEHLDKNLEVNAMGSLEDRADQIQARRTAMQEILRHASYPRFRQFKTTEHSTRFKGIGGPLMDPLADKAEASLDLHSISNLAMEISSKMMDSSLVFNFIWNDCGVKFTDDMHIALNTDLPPQALQSKHYRLMVVVTPSITYRDDTRTSIVARGVTKAQVLVMP